MRAFSVDDETPPFDASYGKTLNDAVFASRGSVLNRSATMRVIDAGSLTLEPQIAARAEAMFLVLNDPAIYAHENGPPASVERLRERFAELEERQSPDRREKWLNWVIRLPNSELIGYVQATVHGDDRAAIAYELSSRYWGQGLAHQAVRAMTTELVERYRVRRLTAVLKQENRRSLRLLERLGFSRASPELHAKHGVEPRELLMHRQCDRCD